MTVALYFAAVLTVMVGFGVLAVAVSPSPFAVACVSFFAGMALERMCR